MSVPELAQEKTRSIPTVAASTRIDAAEVLITSPGRNFVTLRLRTRDGLTGLGDATVNGRELAVASYLRDHVAPLLIGRDAHEIEDTWKYLYRGAYWRRGPITMAAIAAVDTALWDIKAKLAGLPLYQLLGGRSRAAASPTDTPAARISKSSSTRCARTWSRATTRFGSRRASQDSARSTASPPVPTRTRATAEAPPPATTTNRHAAHVTPAEKPAVLRRVREHTTTPLAMEEVFNTIWGARALGERQPADRR